VNPTDTTVTITNVYDNQLAGSIGGPPVPFQMAPGEVETFEVQADITASTTNVVTVEAEDSSGLKKCVATDSVTVTIDPCKVQGGAVKIDKNKLEWRITNTGSTDVYLEKIEIAWPDGNGKLKKIKFANHEIYKPDLDPPSAMIEEGWRGDLKKRKLKKGKTEKLKFEFEHDASKTGAYDVTVTFDNGCVIVF
jgi:hypothetical protein